MEKKAKEVLKWNYLIDPSKINDILESNEVESSWEGFNSLSQIISIIYIESKLSYVVFWKKVVEIKNENT